VLILVATTNWLTANAAMPATIAMIKKILTIFRLRFSWCHTKQPA